MGRTAVMVLACLVVAGCRGATCTEDEDCVDGLTCDVQRGVCAQGSASSSGSASSAGTATSALSGAPSGSSGTPSGPMSSGTSAGASSTGGPGTSSAAPSSGTPCEQACAAAFPEAHVLQWTCVGGAAPAGCRVAQCAGDYADCTDAGTACAVDTLSNAAHCGGCGQPIVPSQATECAGGMPQCNGAACPLPGTCLADLAADGGVHACCPPNQSNCGGLCVALADDEANCGACGVRADVADGGTDRCSSGTPVCGSLLTACPPERPYCLPGVGAECFACTADEQCGGATPICCNGACVAAGAACGCAVEPLGSGALACSAAGIGGTCLATAGAALTAASSPALFHLGACGCSLGDPMPAAAAACVEIGGFQQLCAPSGVTNLGQCAPQNVPPRGDAGQPAGNCGAPGLTCAPQRGGLTCEEGPDGLGDCACNPAAPGTDGCQVPQPDGFGGLSKVADRCLAETRRCNCTADAGVGACQAESATPDCCGTGCVNLDVDRFNCGVCNSICGDGGSTPCGAGVLATGQCGCGTGAGCPSRGGGGGSSCIAGRCVCSTAGNQACAAGTFCHVTPAIGCCEWGYNVFPNSCLPPSGAFAGCDASAGFPDRRICYTTPAAAQCCDNGCTAAGACR